MARDPVSLRPEGGGRAPALLPGSVCEATSRYLAARGAYPRGCSQYLYVARDQVFAEKVLSWERAHLFHLHRSLQCACLKQGKSSLSKALCIRLSQLLAGFYPHRVGVTVWERNTDMHIICIAVLFSNKIRK